MSDDQSSDDELIARIVTGDRDAFALLYRRHRSAIYRFAAHVSGSSSVAEDVVQDVFLAVIEDACRYDAARAAVLPWLLGIARNHVRRWRHRRATQPLPEDDTQAGDALAVTPDPLVQIARQRHVAAVRRALLQLPLRYREIIVLCDLQELSYADAAAALGCAVGTVRSRLHRGRALLARGLGDPEDGVVCWPATRPVI
jgi:RNA polymerase sigma-70 factor, ECF subfamily